MRVFLEFRKFSDDKIGKKKIYLHSENAEAQTPVDLTWDRRL